MMTSVRYFMSVARLGSIRAASHRLNVAQSALSRRVQGLENELGYLLFNRVPNGVRLTEAGRILFEYGLRLESEAQGLQASLGALRSLLKGHIRIATIESMVPDVIPQAISRFRTLHPAITFSVQVTTSERVAGLIQNGSADLGLGLNTRFGPDFKVLSSRYETLVAVTSPSHPLAARASIDLADLAGCNMVLPPAPTNTRLIIDLACHAAGIEIMPAVETYSVALMQQLALSGSSVALLLRHAVSGQIGRGELKELALPQQLFGGSVDVFAFGSRSLPDAQSKFVAVLLDEMSDERRPPAARPDPVALSHRTILDDGLSRIPDEDENG